MVENWDPNGKELSPRLDAVEPVVHGVLKIRWKDGFEGVVDLRPRIKRHPMFAVLDDRSLFERVQLDAYGHSVFWGEPDQELLDFGADQARMWCLEQASILQKAS